MGPQSALHLGWRQHWLCLMLLVCLLAGCVRRMPGSGAPAPVELRPPPGNPTYSPTPITTAASPEPTQTLPVGPPTPFPTDLRPTSTPDLAGYYRQAWVESSPYEPWQAIFVISYPEALDGSLIGDQYHIWVSLSSLQTGTTSSVIDEWRPYDLGYTIPQALSWSDDGQFIFLAETGNVDQSGERFYLQLQRLHLQTGELTPLDLPGGPAVAISPDGQQLARIDEDRLVLTTIETGDQIELRFELPSVEWRTDQIFWSPESDRILFSLRLNPFNPIGEMSSSLYLADLSTGVVRRLVEADRRRFSIRSFPQETAASLADLEAREWWLTLPNTAIRSEPPEDIGQASLAVQSYFNALQAGRYEEAAGWFAGSYEPLQVLNPDVQADDPAGLFSAACTLNGYQCLQVDSMLLEQVTEEGRYLFQVSFIDPEGSLFILNPCCGADLEVQPPVWLFRYPVQRAANGRFKVLDLPIYVP